MTSALPNLSKCIPKRMPPHELHYPTIFQPGKSAIGKSSSNHQNRGKGHCKNQRYNGNMILPPLEGVMPENTPNLNENNAIIDQNHLKIQQARQLYKQQQMKKQAQDILNIQEPKNKDQELKFQKQTNNNDEEVPLDDNDDDYNDNFLDSRYSDNGDDTVDECDGYGDEEDNDEDITELDVDPTEFGVTVKKL